jgi:hypothetical protein
MAIYSISSHFITNCCSMSNNFCSDGNEHSVGLHCCLFSKMFLKVLLDTITTLQCITTACLLRLSRVQPFVAFFEKVKNPTKPLVKFIDHLHSVVSCATYYLKNTFSQKFSINVKIQKLKLFLNPLKMLQIVT